MYVIRDYLTKDGRDIFRDWFRNLKDGKAKESIERRITRMQQGNLGDHKFCRDGVWELRIDNGPGYRIYYAKDNDRIVLLLCDGDKSRQNADVDMACRYWDDWRDRADER